MNIHTFHFAAFCRGPRQTLLSKSSRNLPVCVVFIQDKLEALVRASQAFQEKPVEMEALWNSSSTLIYSLEDRQKQLGLGDKVLLSTTNN